MRGIFSRFCFYPRHDLVSPALPNPTFSNLKMLLMMLLVSELPYADLIVPSEEHTPTFEIRKDVVSLMLFMMAQSWSV